MKTKLPFIMFAAALLAVSSIRPAFAWRSALYPNGWTPGYTDGLGRFLHDFSYAGYHNGEAPIPTIAGPIFNAAATYGADPTGATDSTASIQAAINDAITTGGVVLIPTGLYRCDSVLSITGDNVVLRGQGPANTKIYFTKADAAVTYDGHIHFQGAVSWGADVPLAVDGANRSFTVGLADATSLSVGQEVGVGWVITPAFIAEHGMTGTWTAFTNQWKPVFRRKIVSINTATTPHTVKFDVPLRYPAKTRDFASIRPLVPPPAKHGYLKECGVEDLAISNAVDATLANSLNQVQAILFRDSEDCWVRNVESFASPLPAAGGTQHVQSGGIDVENSNRITVADSRMQLAQNRGSGGNGYLFQVSRSNEVLFRDCYAYAGRHNFIQNWDFGTTGCVWLRCTASSDTGGSEYHHSLAMACLVDSCIQQSSNWEGGNRKLESSGAGHSVTESAFWNMTGTSGSVGSWNYGWGYVIGTGPGVTVFTGDEFFFGKDDGTAPEDYKEGLGTASTLVPQSLYEDQFIKRHINAVGAWASFE